MIGKVVLPYLGGTPQVWNTCMVFFQAALLAGYLYSHEITKRFGLKKQVLFQFVLLLLPLAPLALLKLDVGKIAGGWLPPTTDGNPIPWLLLVLTLVAGLPFFVVATSAPLLQKWYAGTGAMGAKDPYFLYGASNLGSMLSLIAYPTMIEPNLSLPQQARYWMMGYAALLTLTLICGLIARIASRSRRGASGDFRGMLIRAEKEREFRDDDSGQNSVSLFRRLRWILLALVPSSLMLGVTTFVTTDIAPVAMLWIIPLTLYLLTFILVFTRLPRQFTPVLVALLMAVVVAIFVHVRLPQYDDVYLRDVPLTRLLPMQLGPVLSDVLAVRHVLYFVAFMLVCLILPRVTHAVMVCLLPIVIVLLLKLPLPHGLTINLSMLGIGWYTILDKTWQIIALHFVALFVAAMVCHGELARTRPEPRYLTGFYLCMSIGGVLGGCFNAILAPIVFDTLLEYPVMIVAACLLLPRLGLSTKHPWTRLVDMVVPACLVAFGLIAGFYFLLHDTSVREYVAGKVQRWPVSWNQNAARWVRSRAPREAPLLYHERGFFGVVRVRSTESWQGEYHYMQHGNINHGMQRVRYNERGETSIFAPLAACTNPWDAALAVVVRDQVRKDRRRDEPIAYFQSSGPIGDLFTEIRSRNRRIRIGVLGMGTGTLAGYAERGWRIDYYEIDPAVPRIADNPATDYFTYIPDAKKRGVTVNTYLGDGRLQIQKRAEDGEYDLIFMDAFSSDSVPVHLLTKEAIQLYLKKLAPGGIIVVNIANLYLDFKPVFGNLADELGLASMVGDSYPDQWLFRGPDVSDLYACEWVLLARRKEDFGLLNEYMGNWHNQSWWRTLDRDDKVGVWTDDFSNLLGVFDWTVNRPLEIDDQQ
jgi:hypothetical protein